MRIAVALERQHRTARAVRPHRGIEPDLAGATLHFVDIVVRGSRQRREIPPQLDQVAIAIVPILEVREIVDDFGDISHSAFVPQCPLYIYRAPWRADRPSRRMET